MEDEDKLDSSKIIIEFYGDSTNLREIAEQYGLLEIVKIGGKISHEEVLKKQLERTKFVCQICNKEFKAKGIGSKYCPECSTKLKAQRNHDRQINHRKAFEKMDSLKSDIEAKIKASEEALAKSEKEQLQLKARVETLYEIYNNLRENAA